VSLLNLEEQRLADEAETTTLVPNGIYTCRVREVGPYGTGKSLVWKFRIADGECAGREVWAFTGLSAKSIFKTKQFLSALGFPLDAERAQIEGSPCRVVVTVETRADTGEPANKVKRVFAYDGAELPEEAAATDDFPAEFASPSDDDEEELI